MLKKTILCFVAIVIFCVPALANNMAVSSVSLEAGSSGKRNIVFNVAWDNSWFIAGAPSATANWDAAWVFAKYSVYSGGVWSAWKHCKLDPTAGNHTLPGGTPASPQLAVGVTGSYGMGAFLYRSVAATGSIAWTSAKILWDYGADSVADGAVIKIKLFALEMVYIPAGTFYIGDPNGAVTGNFKWQDGTIGAPQITSSLSNAVNTVDNSYDDAQLEGTGIRIDGDGGLDNDANGTIDNASFPTGYNAFYMMKYEVTQQEYAEFLNTLTGLQQGNRVDAGLHYNAYRNFIKQTSSSPAYFGVDASADAGTTTAADITKLNKTTDGKWIACNYLSWMDQAAFADWSGLRPFTELEFEKAARGAQSPVAGEYAWGNTTISAATGPTNSGAINEKSALATANCVYNGSISGPIRVGGIAANSDGTRARSGAGYYGVMELSGDLWERTVTVGNATGRLFTGTAGDGTLSTNGHATNTDWPGVSSGEVTGATGSGFRGGNWLDDSPFARVADRSGASYGGSSRNSADGARLARTSP
ncbi:MAG: SUMF1/EgtB/PvdO family nonheme iron enzyme [Candidatus Omnitrophota bacterium]